MEKGESTPDTNPKQYTQLEWLNYVRAKIDNYNSTRVHRVLIVSDKKIINWHKNGKSKAISFLETESKNTEVTLK